MNERQKIPDLTLRGIKIFQSYLSLDEQLMLVDHARDVARDAPMAYRATPYGKQMSVKMTAAGRVGWYADKKGYRYTSQQPDGRAWPEISESVLKIWSELCGSACLPDSCLVNFYGEGARMGMHQDKDEAQLHWPVLSISLGDRALFRVGGIDRGGKTQSVWLNSGDVLVMGGDARLLYHGVDRIEFRSSSLLSQGGRINLTLRVAS